MSIDLDAIEALTADPYQYAQTSPLVTRGYLWDLLAELRATTADLAVAVEVARERGEELTDLRAGIEALRDEWQGNAATISGSALPPVALEARIWTQCADALDALLREGAR